MYELARSTRAPRRRRALLAVLPVLVALVAAASAQSATLQSATTWGGPGSEVAAGVAAGADGTAYLAGFTTSFDTFGQLQLFLTAFAPDGSLSWQRTWEGPSQFGNDEATEVAVASDGSIYVVGATLGNGGDALVLKFAPDGTLLWQRAYDAGANERAADVALAADGTLYVVGTTSSFDSSMFLIRLAADGTLLSQRTWGPARGDGVAIAGDGSVYVVGTASRPGGAFEFDIVVLKFDAAGTLQWQQAYAGSEIVDARGGVAVAPNGTVFVGGTLQASSQQVVVDALLLAFSPDGRLVFDRGWGGRSGQTGEGVTALPDGSAVLVGATHSYGAGSDDAFMLRVSPRGRGLDGATWGGVEIDNGNDAATAADGSLLIGGTTGSPTHVFGDAPSRAYRVRGDVSTATGVLADATGALADAGGTVAVPAGTTPDSGGFGAALVRVTP